MTDLEGVKERRLEAFRVALRRVVRADRIPADPPAETVVVAASDAARRATVREVGGGVTLAAAQLRQARREPVRPRRAEKRTHALERRVELERAREPIHMSVNLRDQS